MQLKDIMSQGMEVIYSDATVQEASRRMRERQPVGIVSLYDLAVHTRDETLAGTAIRWPG